MQLLLGSIYLLLIVVLLLVLIDRACGRVLAFKRWRQVMRLSALTWFGMSLLKKAYLDSLFPPGDAILHEAIARDIAELLTTGYLAEAFDYFGFGNPAYRFMLGVFYAVTAAPEVVVYAINGALGFWGMLALLEVLCQHAECDRLPARVVVPCLFLPSGLLWTTTNLKEGIVLWGICMMLQLTLSHRVGRSGGTSLFACAGDGHGGACSASYCHYLACLDRSFGDLAVAEVWTVCVDGRRGVGQRVFIEAGCSGLV